MKTPCDRLKTLLSSAPEAGGALATLEAGLASHAETCPRCQGELTRAARLVDGLQQLGAEYTPAPDLVERVFVRASSAARSNTARPNPDAKPSRTLGFLLSGLVGAAAAAVVVVSVSPGGDPIKAPVADTRAVAGSSSDPLRGTSANAPAVAAKTNSNAPVSETGLSVAACLGDDGETSCDVGRELKTAIGETRAFRLSDGSTMRIDQDSQVRFDVEKRALTLVRGDVRLDVAHRDDLEKLIVTLPTGAVEVLGTELELRAGSELSVVDVLRGVVEVAGGGTETKVKAGQTGWLRQGRKPVVRTSLGASNPQRDWRPSRSDGHDEVTDNLGLGSLRARRPGAAADADKPLRLVDHEVDVRIQGAFSRTVVEESFASDEAYELEGTYRFTLPAGAQVEALALLVEGRWEEGAFVERDRAEKIWAGVIRNATPIIKRREIIEYIWVPGPWRDPALLSWKQGNTFELRIFPIPARGERRVRIAYTESLPLVSGGRRYTLPLPGVGSNLGAERFDVDVRIGSGTEANPVNGDDVRVRNYELKRGEIARDADGSASQIQLTREVRGFRPNGDLVVEVPDLEAASDLTTTAWRPAATDTSADMVGSNGDVNAKSERDGYVALTLRPELATGGASVDAGPLDVVIIADTSYGIQKLRLERAGEVVRELVAGLGDDDRVQVLACATECRSFGTFESASLALGKDLGARLSSVEPLGSTRLEAAFVQAHKVFEDAGVAAAKRRIVYLGDGIQSVGELDAGRIVTSIRESVGDTRITAVGLGGESDTTVLAGLAATHAGSFLDVAKLGSIEAASRLAVTRLHGEPLRDVELVLPEGVVAVAPAHFDDLWPGDERIVTARVALEAGVGLQGTSRVKGDVVLRGMLGSEAVERRWTVDVEVTSAAGNAFVPRLWAERRIADLSAGGRDDLGTKKEIVGLSQTHHVLSRLTSLLVLESPAMAKAFDVRPTRAVGDWTGDENAQSEDAELTGASGAVTEASARQSRGDSPMDLAAGLLDDNDARPAEQDLEKKQPTGRPSSGAGGSVDASGKAAPMPMSTAAPTRDELLRPGPNKDIRDWEPRPDPSRGRNGGEWVPMKKVWFKEASINEHREARDGSGDANERELEKRERFLEASPESRERTMAVVRWQLRMNAPDRAETLAKKWLDKDRMDAEALVALADVAALRGDMDRSRDLLASAVEADPRSPTAHLRMARLYEAEGKAALSCEHRLSRALVARSDVKAQADAVRCGGRESRVLAGLEEAVRAKVEREMTRRDDRGDGEASGQRQGVERAVRVSGPFKVDATWDGESDLDLVVISPQGRIVSWLGGAELAADDSNSLSREALAFKGRDNGRWQVLVVRRDTEDKSRAEGQLRISAHGQSRRVSFVIDGDELVVGVADIDVSANFRWERAQ